MILFFAGLITLVYCTPKTIYNVGLDAKPKNCSKPCTTRYDPICALIENKSEKPRTFATKCVLDRENCSRKKGKSKIS